MKSLVKKFNEAMEDMKNGVFDVTDNGKCTQCGQCCSNLLPMTESEVKEIRRYIKKHHVKEFKHASNVYANPVLDMTCPFLNDSKEKEKCSIYPVRPKVCRDFICCPSKRPVPDKEWVKKSKAINVREVFYRENH